MTDSNLQYVIGPAGPAGADGTVDYGVVNAMVSNILTTNPSLKGLKGDPGDNATDSQVAAAAAAYIQANEQEFKGADGVSPTIDYSQVISAIETWMQTDAIKPIFTGDAANVDLTSLTNSVKDGVLAYMAANPNQFKGQNGADGVSPTLNYSTIIEALKSWMQSSPEIISIFKGATGNTGLPGQTPSIDYNIVKNDVNNYLSANLSSLVSPSVIQSAFVDSDGILTTPLSNAIDTSTTTYLTAHPPAGASQSQVDAWIAAYLTANPPSGGGGGGLSVFFHGHFSHIGRFQGLRCDEYAQHLNFNNSQVVRQSESSWDNSTGNHRYVFPSTGRYKISLFIRGSSFADSVENNLEITYYVNDAVKLTTNLYYYANQAAPSSGESNLIYDANANDVFYIRMPASGGHYWVNYANLLIEKVKI
jgi:hypothetical protein